MSMNSLSPINFRLSLSRLPTTTYTIQQASLPNFSINTIRQSTPFSVIKRPGDVINFDDFSVTFKVDENMSNYNEILKWMIGLTKPIEFDQYKNLKNSPEGIYSDATLTIMNSSKNPNIEFIFKNVFPTSLGDIQLDTTEQDVNYLKCTATFSFDQFEFKTL